MHFLLLIILASSNLLFAQQQFNRGFYLSATYDYVIPIGDYQESPRYISTIPIGGALKGTGYSVQGGYFLTQNLAIELKYRHYSNPYYETIRTSMSGNFMLPPHTKILLTEGNYSHHVFSAGISPSIPFRRFAFDFKWLLAYSSSDSPSFSLLLYQMNQEKYYSEKSRTLDAKGIGTEAGFDLRIFILKHLSVAVGINYQFINVRQTVEKDFVYDYFFPYLQDPAGKIERKELTNEQFNLNTLSFHAGLSFSLLEGTTKSK